MNFSAIGGMGGGAGGGGGGCGPTVGFGGGGGGGGGFTLKRNMSRAASPSGSGRSDSSASRCTSGASCAPLAPAVVPFLSGGAGACVLRPVLASSLLDAAAPAT